MRACASMLSKIIETRPAIRSINACPLPLYGMCRRLVAPVDSTNSSAAMWVMLHRPAEPYVTGSLGGNKPPHRHKSGDKVNEEDEFEDE